MKIKIFLPFSLLILSVLSGCVTKTTSTLPLSNIDYGMSKRMFIEKYGYPAQTQESDDKNSVRYLYKEQIFKGKWYIVTTACDFNKGRLKNIEVIKEESLFADNK